MVVQGRELSAEDIGLIQGLMTEHRDWGRTRLSEELCHRWDWRNARGRIKDMAARTFKGRKEYIAYLKENVKTITTAAKSVGLYIRKN